MKPTRRITRSVSFSFIVTFLIWISIPVLSGLLSIVKGILSWLVSSFHMLFGIQLWFLPVCFVIITIAYYFLSPKDKTNEDIFKAMFR
jgi:uncharacterized BrkB/YihY/UPF0761 family membrane protein